LDGEDRIGVKRPKYLNIPRIEIPTFVANRIPILVLILSLSGVLNACVTDGVSQPQLVPEPNKAPQILSISLGCDLNTESVGIKMGDSSEFFLLVDDESPLELTYVVDMQKPNVASVAVDSQGTLLVSALTLGRTELTVKVVDRGGLTDTIVIPIIIDL